jgi:hypothetical protein
MKTKISKFALPIGMGLMLTLITTLGIMLTTFNSCELGTNCKAGYPLWCSQAKVCCPAGHAYYCDGACSASPCPVGTVTVDSCIPE